MPDVTVTIDGKTITVPGGTNVVDAARLAGTAIPVFCYHPKMPPVGMCRMCMVQVGTPRIDRATGQPELDADGKPIIQMMPKLQAGCTTPVTDGMVIHTKSEAVQFAQKGVLEFLLTSHPLDCPVCDKGGECPLQNLTMGWGPGSSRFDYDDKMHFEKPVKLSNLIYLDRERCILCGRCVRFQDIIADDPVLGFDNRGRRWMIISKSEPGFDSKFSGNTTDICPVGALTSADFRFKARVWELKPVPSLDPHGCAGANITLDMRYSKILRVMPRENDYVNEIWIADKTRFASRYVESEQRLRTPLVRKGNKLQPATWEEALGLMSERLSQIKERSGSAAIAGIAGDHSSNEELFAFKRLLTEVLGSSNIDHRSGAAHEPADDTLVARYGVGAGTNLTNLGSGTAVLVLGADPEEEEPIYLLRLRSIVRRGGELIVANARQTKLDRAATKLLPTRYGAQASLLLTLCAALIDEQLADKNAPNIKGFAELRAALKAFSPARAAQELSLSEGTIRAAAKSFASAENRLIVYGREALSAGPQLVAALESLALLTNSFGKANSGLLAILPGPNTRGALDQGYANGALRAPALWGAAREGKLKGLLVLGANPAHDNPASRDALAKLDLLVVHDLFLTETAQLAHVVLPLAAIAEQEGTYTNAERRVQRFRQARQPEGQSRSGWEVARDLAQALAPRSAQPAAVESRAKKAKAGRDGAATAVATLDMAGWDYITVSDVATAISQNIPAYASISYQKLAATGRIGVWGREPNDAFYYDGTSYENTEGVGIQLPSEIETSGRRQISFPAIGKLSAPPTNAEFPLRLAPVYYSYNDSDPLMTDSLLLDRLAPCVAQLSSNDAQRLGIQNGERIRLTSATGAVELPALITAGIADGLVLAPLGMRVAPIEGMLTGPLTAVRLEKVEAA